MLDNPPAAKPESWILKVHVPVTRGLNQTGFEHIQYEAPVECAQSDLKRIARLVVDGDKACDPAWLEGRKAARRRLDELNARLAADPTLKGWRDPGYSIGDQIADPEGIMRAAKVSAQRAAR